MIHKVLPVTKYEGRPDSFAYFGHCFHVFDIKVKHYTFILNEYQIVFDQICTCQDCIAFSTVNMDESLGSCVHGQVQACQEGAGMSIHTPGEKVSQID